MNKIYKVMYSKVKQCCVVVSEIAKSHGKSSTGNASGEHCTGRKLTAMVLTALMGFTLGFATPGTSFALDGEENHEPGTHATVVGGKGNSAWGTDATIAGGSDNNTGAFGAVVVGGHQNVASTYNANTTDENFYIENSTVVGGESNISLGGYSTLVGGKSGVVRGLYSTGIAGGSTDKYARYALAAGYGAVVTNSGVRQVKTPVSTPSGTRTDIDYDQVSTALGYQATANQPGTISFGHDAGDVSGYTVEWVQDTPNALGVYRHSNGDDHNLYDEPPVIKETKYNTAYYNRLVKIANGINSHDAVTMWQMATADNTKANVAADNIGSKLQVAKTDDSGNVVTDSTTGLPVMVDASADEKTANETAWGTAIGTGAIEKDNGQLVTGGTVYNAMLNKANIDMGNISDSGKTVVRNLAKEAVTVADGAHTYVTSETAGNATAYKVNIRTGEVVSGNGDLVTGGAVYDAIQNAKISGGGGQSVDLTGKADVGAGNVGVHFNKFTKTATTDAQKKAEITKNENDWGAALGTGQIATSVGDSKVTDNNGSKQLVTGNTVYQEVRPTTDGKYVTTKQTTAQNLTALDSAIQKQATDLTNSLSVKAGWGIDVAKTSTGNTISLKRNLGTNYTDKEHSGNEKVTVATSATGLVLGGYAKNDGKENDSKVTYGATGDDSVTVGGENALASGEGSVVTGGLDNVASGVNATVVSGDYNDASGKQSIVLGGRDNNASGDNSTVSGGYFNVASGNHATALGGFHNHALGTGSTSIGGYGKDYTTGNESSVNGIYSVGIAGGSTGEGADSSLAAGNQSVVTVANGTAIGYQATTNTDGTIAFGHDAGDVSGYTVEWEKLPDGQLNADGTNNDYSKAPKSVTGTTTYTSSYYNRLVKVAEGQDDHDVVVVKQLKQYAQKDAGNIGSNIKVYKTDEKGSSVEDTDAETKAQNDSKDAWGKALGAGTLASSTAASNSDQLITGKTLYNYDKPNADGTYVKLNQTTGQNLSALDSQVAKNTTKLDDENHNIKYYSVKDKTPDDKLLPSIPGYLNDKNDGAKGAGSMAAGFSTHADGIASTVAGSYSGVVGTGLQGAAALSYGTFNVNQNTDQSGMFSGVANSIVGQANVTTDSNAAIIYGAGNTVKNSYRDIDTKNASEIRAAAGSGDVTKLSEALQKAVPTSGGQVMVMGGGNSVENAYMTQVTGVGNKVTGTQTWSDEKDADNSGVTQLNFIDGFYSSLENGHNDYMIGAYNKLKDSDGAIIFGDNNGQKFFASSNDSKPQKDNINFVNVKNSIAIGSNNNFISKADKAHGSLEDVVAVGNNNTVSGSSHAIAIGDQNTIHNGEAWQGDPKSINSSGNVAIGYNTKIWYDATYGSDGESIVIGKNASAYNPVGTLEKTFNFGNEDLKNQKSGFTGSIAIGENAFARSGSTTIGVHRYKGTLGDINVDPTSTPSGYSGNNGVGNSMLSSNATTVGNETYNNGVFSTAMGSYTSLSGLYSHQKWGDKYYGLQNFGAAVIGSLDSVESLTSTQGTAGMADSILGSANRTQNANGTVMVGAGNVVTNSAVEFGADEIKTAGSENPNKLSEAMRTSIRNAKGGGAASVIGNGNIVDSSTSVSVVGAKNEVYNTKNAQIFASNRTIGTKTPDTTSTGDATIEVKPVENSVIIGSASVDSPVTTTKSNVTILGYNANAEVDDGVALGSESVARTGAGDAGYDPTTGNVSTDNSIAWKATRAAVSIGNTDEKVTDKVTRQLTGLAAGTNDTDAVNVAQLRKLGNNTVQYDLNTKKGKITLAGKDGTTITNVKSALVGAKDANGKDATIATATGADLSNAVNLKDLQDVYNEVNSKADKANSSHTALTVEGGKAAGTEEGSYTGDNILLHATTNKETGKVTYDLKLNNDIMIGNKGKDGVSITGPQGEAGKDGIDGKVGISGKDGKDAVSISGKDGVGHIGLTGPAGTNGKDGADGTPGTSIDIMVKNGYNTAGQDGKDGINGENGVDGTSLTRVVYEDKTGEHQIATMEDGMKYAGDNYVAASEGKAEQNVINKKLNNQLDIIGGADSNNLTDSNIGVNSTTDGKLKVQLAKDLKGLNSATYTTTTGEGKSAKTSTTVVNGNGLTINGGPSITNNGIDGGKKTITNVGSGIIAGTDGKYTVTDANNSNAANIGDVNNMVKQAVGELSDATKVNLAGKANVDASNLTADDVTKWQEKLGNGKVESGDKGLVTGDTVFKVVDTKANRDGSNLTVDEANKFSEKIAVGKVEADDMHAVSGDAVSKAISKVTGDVNTKLDGKANTSLDNITDGGRNVIRKLAKDSIEMENGNHTTVSSREVDGVKSFKVDVMADGKVESGNKGLISGGTAYTELRPADGSYVKQNSTTAANLTALDKGLKATSDLIHTAGDTIQIGGTSTATKIDVSGKDASGKTTGRVITGVVSDANDPNSAANVGYVNGLTAANTQQIYRDMNNAYGRLNNNINKAAAGSNALAALHPLDYDPDDKADFAVGYGHYRNANAAAVGAFYHPNENTMVNVGVSLGNGDPGFNAGVSFKIGSGSAGRQAMSKTEMAKVINSQSKEIDALKKDNADKDKRIDALEQKMAEILAKLDKNGK